jgi:hypothetical protein
MSKKTTAVAKTETRRTQPEFVQAGGLRPAREQRTDKRVVSVFRLAKLVGAQEELCLIRNISAGGLKAEVFSPKSIGDRLAIDLGDNQPQPAQVVWTGEDCVGISFDDRIDVARTLARVPAPGDRRARRLRLLLEFGAFVAVPGRRTECQVIDVSQGGAKIRTNAQLGLADRVRLEVDELGTISGTVRWLRDSHVGIAFTAPLSYRQLASWIATGSAAAEPEPEPEPDATPEPCSPALPA